MCKKYSDFMDEITSQELYEGLLAHGLFAEKLPPVFTSADFFDYCKTASNTFDKKKWNEYISFRVMRNINIPRLMGIPNPFKYQILCSVLRDNWNKIQKHFHKQTDNLGHRISRIHIRKESGTKRIFAMNYKNWHVDGNPELDLLILDEGASRILVQADISSCFPSIYTHSIPWALAGKVKAKQNRNSKEWFNMIDKACQAMRNGETHGLLIGPHTSNILSEIILTVVDKNLYRKGYRFVRNIDDYDCYVDSHDKAQMFLCDLQQALCEFDLHLNHKKTKITELPIGFDQNWKHQLSDLPKIGKSKSVEYPQVNTFIDTAIKLAKESGDFAIINYSIKKLKEVKLSKNGEALAAKRFMHLAMLNPYLLHLMEEFVFYQYHVPIAEIKKFSDAIYRDATKVNDYESMCYSFYFAIQFDFDLDAAKKYDKMLRKIIKSGDCILLTMTWIYFMIKNKGNSNTPEIIRLTNEARNLAQTEMDRYWLFCYEALSPNDLSNEWARLKKARISFIREDIRVKLTNVLNNTQTVLPLIGYPNANSYQQ